MRGESSSIIYEEMGVVVNERRNEGERTRGKSERLIMGLINIYLDEEG